MNVGDKIPEILGIDQDGREIKAKATTVVKLCSTVIEANTNGCTAEACSLQAHKEELAAAGYEIIGVSKDKQALQKKFAETKGLQFPLIADTETTLLQELGCWGEKVTCGRKTIGILRTTYLVNEEGVIEKIFLLKRSRPRFMPSRFWITFVIKNKTDKWEKGMLEHIADFVLKSGIFIGYIANRIMSSEGKGYCMNLFLRYCGQLCRRHHQQSTEHRTVWQGLSYQLHFCVIGAIAVLWIWKETLRQYSFCW